MSKTDQESQGAFRSLYLVGWVLCPVLAWKALTTQWDITHVDGGEISSGRLVSKVRELIKWVAKEFRLGGDLFSVHSLRAGGGSNLYASGVDLGVIRRFGRWRSANFRLYLRGGSRALRNLTSASTSYNGMAENVRAKDGGRVGSFETNRNISETANKRNERLDPVRFPNGRFSFCVGSNKPGRMSADEMSLSVSDSIVADSASLDTFSTRRSDPSRNRCRMILFRI